MGFGRGKGFTEKAVQLLATVLVKGGGGKCSRTETVLTATAELNTGSYP